MRQGRRISNTEPSVHLPLTIPLTQWAWINDESKRVGLTKSEFVSRIIEGMIQAHVEMAKVQGLEDDGHIYTHDGPEWAEYKKYKIVYKKHYSIQLLRFSRKMFKCSKCGIGKMDLKRPAVRMRDLETYKLYRYDIECALEEGLVAKVETEGSGI